MATFVPHAVEESDDVVAYANQAKAQSTRHAYRADWRDFEAYLKKRKRTSLPADLDEVARYLRHLARYGEPPFGCHLGAAQSQRPSIAILMNGLQKTHFVACGSSTARLLAAKLPF